MFLNCCRPAHSGAQPTITCILRYNSTRQCTRPTILICPGISDTPVTVSSRAAMMNIAPRQRSVALDSPNSYIHFHEHVLTVCEMLRNLNNNMSQCPLLFGYSLCCYGGLQTEQMKSSFFSTDSKSRKVCYTNFGEKYFLQSNSCQEANAMASSISPLPLFTLQSWERAHV